MKYIDLNLPEFAFLDDQVEKEHKLKDRNVILHVRTASVIEIFDREDVIIKNDILTFKFSYTNVIGVKEPMIAVLHYCATLDILADSKLIKDRIMKPCAQWYCYYCTWEDNNVMKMKNEEIMIGRERIGKKIAEIRKNLRLSQTKLGELTGIAPGNIARIESGKYSTGIDLLSRIANALGCEVDILPQKEPQNSNIQLKE